MIRNALISLVFVFITPALTQATELRGTGDLGLVIERASGSIQIIETTGNSSLGELAFYQKSGFRITGVKRDFFADYDPPIFENGIRCLDMVILTLPL